MEGAGGASYRDPASRRFARVAEIFEGARTRPSAEREQYLQAACGTDEELAREVRRLLAFHEQEDERLPEPERMPELLGAALEQLDPKLERAPLPESIGPYRVLEQLGQGGMGTVYLARREEGDFEQKVAIKVLRPDRVDEELLLRFRTERRILAGLRHKHIAALLDGGSLEDGRPYVVMEYVEGLDLLRHARERRLPLAGRIQLFRAVCGAVEHAHRSLIVHRDLKPGNILVTTEGEPKLLDFGIAKLLGPELGQHSAAVTSTGMYLLTPEYASPEQVRGEAITTQSDVYSLGAILYELLTGQKAHRFRHLRPAELERVVCEEEPRPPSMALGQAEREAGPERLPEHEFRRALAGDLDTIVLMALRKEPERRYGSVAALSDDLGRYLAGLPVTARKDTLRYRCTKFLARHRLASATGAVLVLVVIGAAASLYLQARRLERERDRARLESEVARQVTEFLVGLFETAEPDQALGEQVKAREVLDRGASRIQHELEDDPSLRADLMAAMGRAYLALGLMDSSEPLLEESLRLRAGLTGAEARGSALPLGLLRYAQGRYPEAEQLLREALAGRRAAEDGSLESRHACADAELELASFLRDMGKNEEALELARSALALQRELHHGEHRDVAHALAVLSRVHEELGEYEQAEALLLEARTSLRSLFGAMHPDCAGCERQLGYLYQEMGRYDESRAAYEEALRVDRAILGDDHPDVDSDLFGLASLAEEAGELDRAEALDSEVLERDRRRLGKHPHVAIDLTNLANVLSMRGRYDEALTRFDEALALQRELLPADHPEIATTLANKGVLYHRRRQYQLAREFFEAALEQRRLSLPADHPLVLTSLSQLAVIEQEEGRYEEAERRNRELLELRRQQLGEHPDVAGSHYALAVSLLAQRKLEEAEEHLRESIALDSRLLPAEHLDLARPKWRLGDLLVETGRAVEAEPLLVEALRVRQALLVPAHHEIAQVQASLARCRIALGQPEEAEPLLREALPAYVATYGEGHPLVGRLRSDLARLLETSGRQEEAAELRGEQR